MGASTDYLMIGETVQEVWPNAPAPEIVIYREERPAGVARRVYRAPWWRWINWWVAGGWAAMLAPWAVLMWLAVGCAHAHCEQTEDPGECRAEARW